MSKRKGIYVSNYLVKLLISEKKDMNNPNEYDEMQKLAKSMLRLLVEVDNEKQKSKANQKTTHSGDTKRE